MKGDAPVSSGAVQNPRRGLAFWFPAALAGFLVLVLLPALLVFPLAQVLTSPAAVAAAKQKQPPLPFDEAGIRYGAIQATGPVEQLAMRLSRGEHALTPGNHGYLLPVLEALQVPRSSQILVFSKTSSDKDRISPRTPRAIYFNDEVYVAWIPGAQRLEIAATDPRLGAVFYTASQKADAPARLSRNDRCLECHTSAANLGVPGFLARSVVTDDRGAVDWGRGLSYVSHRTPLSERWGGWYVCGSHGNQTHLGNLVGGADFDRQAREPNFRGNQANLSGLLDLSPYPEPTSDIVALLVFEHQCHTHNFISRLRQDTEATLERSGAVEADTYLKGVAEAFIKHLLFIDEARLSARVQGTSDFGRSFESRGPRDRQGRSLRQFDLQTRLFKHPCSYLIYSPAFDSLPRPMKLHLYGRLWKILGGTDPDPAFRKLAPETRQAIREILADTKPDVPLYWTL